MILVSGCLVGLRCNYRGDASSINEKALRLFREGRAYPVCPEQMGGLPTPRLPAEIEPGKTSQDVLAGNGRVIDAEGRDVTEQFLRGAQSVLLMARTLGVEGIMLKDRSPSCGVTCVYDGTFSGRLIDGRGVTAALLFSNGFDVFTTV